MFRIVIFSATLLFITLFLPRINLAQSGFDISSDLVSNYVWRGLMQSPTLNFQPTISYTNKNELFSAGIWGSYGVGRYFGEVNVYANINLGSVSIYFTDYIVDSDEMDVNFFEFRTPKTGHSAELMAQWEVSETIPITLTWGTFIWGNDLDESNNPMYSSYFEMMYALDYKETPMDFFAGLTPWSGLYADKFALINIGFGVERILQFSEKGSFPVRGSFIINPERKKAWLVFTITI